MHQFKFKTITTLLLILTVGFMFLPMSRGDVTSVDYWNRTPLLTNGNLGITVSNTGDLQYVMASQFKGLEPLGYEKINENLSKYLASATYEITMDFWSAKTIQQALTPSTSRGSINWLTIRSSDDFALRRGTATNYWADYGQQSVNVNNAKGYDGKIQIACNLKDITPSVLDFGSTTFEIKNKGFTSTLDTLSVVSSFQKPLSTYTTTVDKVGSTGTVTSLDLNSVQSQDGIGVSQKITEMDLYVKRGNIWEVTYQQGANTPPVVGSNIIQSQGMNLQLIPQIIQIKEQINYRSATIAIDTATGWFGVSPAGIIASECTPVKSGSVERIVGYKIDQYACQVKLQAVFLLYSTMEVKVTKQADVPTLQLPDAQIGPLIYDASISGDTGAQVILDTTEPVSKWFGNLLGGLFSGFSGIFWLIIGVITLYLFIKIGIPLITAKWGKKQ